MAIRREARHLAGRVKTAKLAPALATPFLPGEGGLLTQSVSFELDPIGGRMLSSIYAKVICMYVPVQAALKLRAPADPNAGVTEILRRKIMNGEPLLAGGGNAGEISNRLGIVPQKIGGSTKVNDIGRISFNVAVNALRKRKYVYATERLALDATVPPAIIDRSVLDYFNGVLDPDEHINGEVKLMPNETKLHVRGLGVIDPSVAASNYTVAETAWAAGHVISGWKANTANSAGNIQLIVKKAASANEPLIQADATDLELGGFSLGDLYNGQKADDLVRAMRKIADAHPLSGEDAVLRWALGLEIDDAQFPFVLYEKRFALGERRQKAVDAAGMEDEVSITTVADRVTFSVPVPKTELGGIVITMFQVTPDEVISQQPHPILSGDFGAANHAADQLRIDPVPVIYRELFADVQLVADETAQKFYTGYNELKRNYVQYGFTRNTDLNAVSNKTVMWTYAIPAGVSPDNINYPESFVQYPFLDQEAEVVTYSVESVAAVNTPMFFGPTPVEKVAIVDSKNILDPEDW